jgi:hypothetical protein
MPLPSNDREGIRVQRHQHRDRQVDVKSDREQRRREELHRVAPGYQAGEQADRDPAGDRAPMQMPQVGVLQARPETGDVPVLPYGFVARQVLAEELAGHGAVTKAVEGIVTKDLPTNRRAAR